MRLAQKETDKKTDTKKSTDEYKPDNDAWIPDCDPERNMSDPKLGSGVKLGAYPGVGITCQGFA